ncbi:DDB1- and CUL4-associated factor 8 [Diabrotica virgifera virgifera]|uniref:DDB1- and CUL4-associated factor 8 n=1 Tax=Diabrotica virgifera virgifera TaxID=50390 RepID=A0ABM5KU77_DIAVI|nr:DDB1- and CUL4-associated factor 8 [Diabrotica virgifera virgifera]
MDDNISDDENRKKPASTPGNSKRLKTEGEVVEESSSTCSNTEQETASTSTDSGFPRSRNSKNRNYRNHTSSTENQENRSSNEDDYQGDDEDSALHEEHSEDEEDNLDDVNPARSSTSSSNSTIVCFDTEADSDDSGDLAVLSILKKEKPKHGWFIVPEINNRQLGANSKMQSSDLFQKRCYGSLHSVQRLELMYKLEGHDGCVNSLNFHPNGQLLASGSDDLQVVLWDWKLGKSMLKYDSKHKGNVFQTKFLNLSGDMHIASCARDGQVRIAQVSQEEGLRENRKLGCHRGPCHKISVIAEQPHIVLSAGEDGIVYSHDVRKSKQERLVTVKEDDKDIALYTIHSNPLRTLEFCVGGRDELIRVYDQRKSDEPLHTYHPFKERGNSCSFTGYHVTCAVYNHDGSQILGSYNDDDIYLFDCDGEPGTFLHQYKGHRNGATIKGVNFFGPRSEFIVSGSDCGNLYFWDKNTESIVQWLLADDSGVVNCLEPHPQVPFICTSGLDWDIKVWVPSCETDNEMKGLGDVIKSNNKNRLNWTSRMPPDINESQMLWMLWRHLRTSNRRDFPIGPSDISIRSIVFDVDDASASMSSSSSDFGSDDIPTGCSPS